MRIGGLASGIDVDEMVDKLMAAERKPLERMEQDKTELEWKRDGFRDVNKSLLKLKNMMLDMKMNKTYQSKNVSSSNESAVKVTANSSAGNGTYKIQVEKLATSAMNTGSEKVDLETALEPRTITFETFSGGDENNPESHKIEIEEGDTIKDVLDKISKEDNNVRAFYDEQTKNVTFETTRTGQYNKDGPEIRFGSDKFFTETLGMAHGNENGGTDATFTYNDNLTLTSKDNSYTLNDVTFNFNNVTKAGEAVVVTVDNNTEESFDKIVAFVDKYNEVIDVMNKSQREERHRDFPPLTDEQKGDMSEKEIEKWEEKAKSGILKGESAISSGMFSMRSAWYSQVETGGDLTSLTQIGIKTSSSYMDGGKLVVDEDKLKAALSDDSEGVYKLFSNNSDDDKSKGLVNRLEDSLKQTMDTIKNKAGGNASTLENYTLGKRMKDIDTRIDSFQVRLVKVEDRYWSQFTAMEKAIQSMNQQSDYLMSQFGEM